MPQKKQEPFTVPGQFEVLLDLLVGNQAMLLTLLSREAKRIADSGTMTYEQARDFMLSEAESAKEVGIEALLKNAEQWLEEEKKGR